MAKIENANPRANANLSTTSRSCGNDGPAVESTDNGSDKMNMMTSITVADACVLNGDSNIEWSVQDWLARFEAVGGFIVPGSIGWHIADRTEEEHLAARCIYGEIENDDERMNEVLSFSCTPEQIERYRRSCDPKDERVGPDLTKARPIEDVVKELAPMRNGYATAFWYACKDSGIDLTVIRDADGKDMVMLGCPLDGQEDLRRLRMDALTAQMHRGKNRRRDVIELLNLTGRFYDNQPFNSIAEAAEAYLAHGGRIFVRPDGRCKEVLPYRPETPLQEGRAGYPHRRLVCRYRATLLKFGDADMVAYVREHGTLHEGSGCVVLEAKVRDHA